MASRSFEEWVAGVLDAVGVDGEVYGVYISGSLDTAEGMSGEEMTETVMEILSVCLVSEPAVIHTCIQY